MKLLVIAFITVTTASGWLISSRVSHSSILVANYVVDTLATGLIVPWEIIFLPDKTMVFTERSGMVRLFRNKALIPKPALVLNDVATSKKMGLLSLCIHPQFAVNKYLYLSYNYLKENSALLKIVRYRFVNDTLTDPKIILENIKGSPNHTGCRLLFGPDQKLYITTGDADRPILAQDLKSLNGKILRVNDDGSIPADNPFVNNDTAGKAIWSYGHRNTQGLAFQPGTGILFNSEHGPTGGDEINRIQRGSNYGWPLVHHNDERGGMVSPLLEYTPSIGPSQILFYSGSAFPSLKGDLLVATLRGEKIMHLQVQNGKPVWQDNLIEHSYGRIRALTQGPDGYVYFSTSQNDPPEGKPIEGYDMVLRLRPALAANTQMQATAAAEKQMVKTGKKQKTTAGIYIQLCAGCHGANLEGSERAAAIKRGAWKYGSQKKDVMKSIREGIIEKGMPAWEGTLTKKEIQSQAEWMLAKAKRK